MTSKQKAEDLVMDYYCNIKNNSLNEDILLLHKLSVKCALICCDEVLGYMGADRGYVFWTEVKEELLKM